MTKQRKLIFDIVNTSCIHPTVEQVFEIAKLKMPGIVMATVYNNINALTDAGLIRRITCHGEPDRYDNAYLPHEHLKCKECGNVTDVFLKNCDLLDELKQKTGQDIASYELNMYYICDNCRG